MKVQPLKMPCCARLRHAGLLEYGLDLRPVEGAKLVPRVHVRVLEAPCKEALIELVLVEQPRILHACWTAPAAAALARALHYLVAAAGFKVVAAASSSTANASTAAGVAALVVAIVGGIALATVFSGPTKALGLVLPQL